MESLVRLCMLIGAITGTMAGTSDLISHEMRLYDSITSKNNPYIRPVYNLSETTRVQVGAALISIIDLLWKDLHIKWDPKDFGGVRVLRIPIDKIWRPDIRLYNEVKEGGTTYEDVSAVVYSDGSTLFIPPAIVRSSCSVDMTYFPYDRQVCVLKFGSWTHDGFSLDLDFYAQHEEIDLSDYIASSEWVIEEAPASKNVKYYPCCEEPYPDLTFTLKFSRRAGMKSLVYVAPIFFLAILCPIIFLMPYSETQRFSLGGSLLICLAIMLSSLERIFPAAHGTMPLLAQYYVSVVVLLVLSLIFSAIITNVADRSKGTWPMPWILKLIFLDVFGKVLCVSTDTYDVMDNEGITEEGSTSPTNSANRAAEWKAMAQAMDRFFFIIYVILTVILSFVFLAK